MLSARGEKLLGYNNFLSDRLVECLGNAYSEENREVSGHEQLAGLE